MTTIRGSFIYDSGDPLHLLRTSSPARRETGDRRTENRGRETGDRRNVHRFSLFRAGKKRGTSRLSPVSIEESGGSVDRIEEGHGPDSVSSHKGPHINYTTVNGEKAAGRNRGRGRNRGQTGRSPIFLISSGEKTGYFPSVPSFLPVSCPQFPAEAQRLRGFLGVQV